MDRISSITQKRIVELWFQGWPRDQIAHQLGVSGSTVSKIVHLLPESLKELRSTRTELRKHNLSPAEAKDGVRLIAKLAQLGIRPHELERFIKTLTKISKEAGYEPAQVVKGAMTLSELEAEAGKPYAWAIQEFKATTKRRKHFKAEIRKLKAEHQQRLAQSKVTENEIAHYTELQREFRAYGIDLSDVETLRQCLQNMKETNGDPRKFVEYTRKHGSLEKRKASLGKQVKTDAGVLRNLRRKIKICDEEANRRLAELPQLDAKIHEKRKNLKTLGKEELECQARLSNLLEGELEGKTTKEALDSQREKLNTLKERVEVTTQTLHANERSIQETEVTKQNLEREIAEALRIQDYVGEGQAAIKKLEDRVTSLNQESTEKSDRLALADTITNFLTGQAPYDFHIFYTYVQDVKRAREQGSTSRPGDLPRTEEKARQLALQAFKGDLISTKQHRELMQKHESCEDDNRKLKKKVSRLEARNAETEGNLERVTHEKLFLEAIPVTLEGRSITLGELRNWIRSTYQEEIEREVARRFHTIEALTNGVLNFLTNRTAGESSTQRSGQE